jgi:hypothetical protein
MSFREDNENNLFYSSLNQNVDNGNFSVSCSKTRQTNVISVKNSSNKKRSKTIKINEEKKPNENEKNQINTPQSNNSRIKRGLAVTINLIIG